MKDVHTCFLDCNTFFGIQTLHTHICKHTWHSVEMAVCLPLPSPLAFLVSFLFYLLASQPYHLPGSIFMEQEQEETHTTPVVNRESFSLQ